MKELESHDRIAQIAATLSSRLAAAAAAVVVVCVVVCVPLSPVSHQAHTHSHK